MTDPSRLVESYRRARRDALVRYLALSILLAVILARYFGIPAAAFAMLAMSWAIHGRALADLSGLCLRERHLSARLTSILAESDADRANPRRTANQQLRS